MIPSVDQLDADARAMRDAWRSAGLPAFETMTPLDARRLLADLQRARRSEPRTIGLVRDLSCEGTGSPIPLRLYHPCPGTRLPAILFFHGGGWVLNHLESHDAFCRALAGEANVAVLAVDYRLAPEHPYPAAVDDAISATSFLKAQAEELDLDASRLILAGDSAGGTLAATAALHEGHANASSIRGLLLFYPALDLAMTGASHALEDDGLAVTGRTMKWFRNLYLGDNHGPLDWRMSPAAAESFAAMPPCYLLSAGVDPLRDEAFDFAFRLAQAGVRVIHDHVPGQMHGFLTAALDGGSARAAIRRVVTFLQDNLIATTRSNM